MFMIMITKIARCIDNTKYVCMYLFIYHSEIITNILERRVKDYILTLKLDLPSSQFAIILRFHEEYLFGGNSVQCNLVH